MVEDRKSRGNVRRSLVERGDFDGALQSLDEGIAETPREGLLYRERAHLHLYLGQTQQARSDFDVTARLANEVFRTRPGRLHSDNEHNAIGITYWMEGHRELALAFWRYTTRSLFMNRVSYSRTGGGIEAGLHLWFGAIHERTEDDIDLVRNFYEKRLVSTHWSHNLKSWPGPIVRFFLKQIDESRLIDDAKTSEHNLCEAHFAVGLRAREQRRYAAYRKHLKLAAFEGHGKTFYNFYNVFPYFLARFETQR
jgi:hypothetical protein